MTEQKKDQPTDLSYEQISQLEEEILEELEDCADGLPKEIEVLLGVVKRSKGHKLRIDLEFDGKRTSEYLAEGTRRLLYALFKSLKNSADISESIRSKATILLTENEKVNLKSLDEEEGGRPRRLRTWQDEW